MSEISIKKLSNQDILQFIEMITLFEVVFEMENFTMPDQNHLQKVLNSNDFHAFVALSNSKIVGGLTVYTLDQYYSTKPLAYIYDLAVASDQQRKGIGRQLISTTREHFSLKNYEEVFVQADKVDTHAVAFYRSTKPSEEEDVSHFYYLL